MTHPDILKMERDGCLYDEGTPLCSCCRCGHELFEGEGESYYKLGDDIYCDSCILDFRRFS